MHVSLNSYSNPILTDGNDEATTRIVSSLDTESCVKVLSNTSAAYCSRVWSARQIKMQYYVSSMNHKTVHF